MKKLTLGATALFVSQKRITSLSADTTTRLLTITLDDTLGDLIPAGFPSEGIVPVTYESAGNVLQLGGIVSWIRDADNVITGAVLDRGYWHERIGIPQPDPYVAPTQYGLLTLMNSSTRSVTAQNLLTALLDIVTVKNGAAGNYSIFEGVGGDFAITESDPQGLTVEIASGVASIPGGLITGAGETFTLSQEGMTATNKRKAALYINPETGAVEVTYGAQHATTPVAPAWPSNVIRLGLVTLTNGDTTIANANIDMEREGFAGDV
jgi:hypothetical protein